MKTLSNRMMVAIGAIIAAGLASCATQVPIKSVKMPTIDTTGIQRMAVAEFQNVSGTGGPAGAQITQHLSSLAEQKVAATGKFTMVSPNDPNKDGTFTGKVTLISNKDTQKQVQKKDKDGTPYNVTVYRRDVNVDFQYGVVSARTDMAVGTVMKKGSTYAESENTSTIPDVATLGKRIVDSQMSDLSKDIVPYIVATKRKLMEETSKDKAVKEKMKAALAIVKAGNYPQAIQQFDAISRDHDSSAAAFNAALLREAIASDAAATARLSQLFEDKGGLVERAVNSALTRLNAKVPAGANITLVKGPSTERGMLDYAVDQMTKTLVQEGKIKVVDRSNQALIAAEQQFQVSGAVSDSSMVSLGKQIGVKFMVICSISGEKSLRRLNVKVLNVETGQITDQGDFEV